MQHCAYLPQPPPATLQLRARCRRRGGVVRAGAMQPPEAQREPARVALLRLRLDSPPRACPTGLLRAAAAATSERLYIACEPGAAGSGSGEAASARGDEPEATLGFLTCAFDAVAAASPRLDARFLFPGAGWDAAAVAALPGVECELVTGDAAAADSDDGAGATLPRRVLHHDASMAAVEAPPPAPASALHALRSGGLRGLLRHLNPLAPPPPGRLVLGRKPPYGAVVVAGTFDRLHAGHRLLLASAAISCASDGALYLGITGDKLTASKRRRELLQPYAQREAAALAFVRGTRPGLTVHAGVLDNPLRGIRGQPEVDAIVVSREVVRRIQVLNLYKCAAALLALLLPPLRAMLRARLQGLVPYAVVVVDLVGQDGTQKLSSTALREQDAARAGAT